MFRKIEGSGTLVNFEPSRESRLFLRRPARLHWDCLPPLSGGSRTKLEELKSFGGNCAFSLEAQTPPAFVSPPLPQCRLSLAILEVRGVKHAESASEISAEEERSRIISTRIEKTAISITGKLYSPVKTCFQVRCHSEIQGSLLIPKAGPSAE
jgi:hypothetical protein